MSWRMYAQLEISDMTPLYKTQNPSAFWTKGFIFILQLAPQVKILRTKPITVCGELSPTNTTRSLEFGNSPCSPFICYSKQAVIWLFSTYDDE